MRWGNKENLCLKIIRYIFKGGENTGAAVALLRRRDLNKNMVKVMSISDRTINILSDEVDK